MCRKTQETAAQSCSSADTLADVDHTSSDPAAALQNRSPARSRRTIGKTFRTQNSRPPRRPPARPRDPPPFTSCSDESHPATYADSPGMFPCRPELIHGVPTAALSIRTAAIRAAMQMIPPPISSFFHLRSFFGSLCVMVYVCRCFLCNTTVAIVFGHFQYARFGVYIL